MAPKKPIRRNNKKKKGGSSDDVGICNSSSQQQQQQQQQAIPNFRSETAPPSPNSDTGVAAGGLYGVYKRATQRFKDGLAALVPVEIFARDRVQTMMDAVDYIVENEVSVHPVLLEDCRISLHFCKKYSEKMAEDRDEGHEYIILVLNYCLQTLKPLIPVASRKASKEKAKKFSFCDLQLSDSEDEEEEEFAIPAKAKRTKRPVEPTHEYTFQDLIQGNDRMQACAFMDTAELGMASIALAYKGIKFLMRFANLNSPKEASSLLERIMEAAVTINFCIRQMQLMEEELQRDNPHLSTFYRIITCVHLMKLTEEMNNVARACKKSVPKTDMIAFVGDVVESGFRNQNDPQNRVNKLTKDFCRKWSLPRDEITRLVNFDIKMVHFETQPDNVEQPAGFRLMLQSSGLASYKWLCHMQFLGGDRSILNTHRLIQGLSTLLMKKIPVRGHTLKEGSFGTMWDEQLRPARKIQGDMDQLLMGDILVELLACCQDGLLSKIPKMEELLPLFQSLQHYVANPTKPVPLSLSFGVHAILTSIFEVQGHIDVATIGTSAKISYNHFFDQLQEQFDSELPNSTIWRPNLKSMMLAKFVPTCDDNAINKRAVDRAYWNPCCAGMFLTFLTYHINLDGGAVMIDSFAQLRMVLHLYNALRQRGLIEGDIPLISSLDKYFENVPSVWKEAKPNRENIVTTFWLTYGMRVDVTKRIHEECRRFVLDPMYSPNAVELNTSYDNTTREVTECRPEHFSKSYRRICLGDFSGMIDRHGYFHDEMEIVPAWQLNFAVRVYDTLALMNDEEELLSCNLMAVGGCLNAFIYVLMERLGWKQSLDEKIATSSSGGRRMDGSRLDPRSSVASDDAYEERFALVMMFANKLLGPLEFLETVDHHPVLLAARDCLVDYFATLDPSKYKFFDDGRGSQGPVSRTTTP